MRLIDFDSHFQSYMEQWVKFNRKHYKTMDEMEDRIPELYMRWISEPQAFLDGKVPEAYFQEIESVNELIDLLQAYQEGGVSVPDLLLEAIADRQEEAVRPLMELARGGKDEALRVTALNLLTEIGAIEAMEMCLDIISAAEEPSDTADVAAELLKNLGEACVVPILDRMENAPAAAQDIFLDVLCNFPGNERIYSYVENAFKTRFDQRALFASYLAKLGDARAIEPLRASLMSQDINYLDYIEIVNAIEALGGEVDDSRDFSGDPYYESLRTVKS